MLLNVRNYVHDSAHNNLRELNKRVIASWFIRVLKHIFYTAGLTKSGR